LRNELFEGIGIMRGETEDRSLIQIKVKDRGCGDTATSPLASDFAGVPS